MAKMHPKRSEEHYELNKNKNLVFIGLYISVLAYVFFFVENLNKQLILYHIWPVCLVSVCLAIVDICVIVLKLNIIVYYILLILILAYTRRSIYYLHLIS